MNGYTESKETEEIMSNTGIDGLNDIYRDLADEIGFENTIVIYNMFKGSQVSFPCRLFSVEHIHEMICRDFTGDNIAQLAQKYNYSERTIRRIIKEKE